jgi:hypothetical protein
MAKKDLPEPTLNCPDLIACSHLSSSPEIWGMTQIPHLAPAYLYRYTDIQVCRYAGVAADIHRAWRGRQGI